MDNSTNPVTVHYFQMGWRNEPSRCGQIRFGYGPKHAPDAPTVDCGPCADILRMVGDNVVETLWITTLINCHEQAQTMRTVDQRREWGERFDNYPLVTWLTHAKVPGTAQWSAPMEVYNAWVAETQAAAREAAKPLTVPAPPLCDHFLPLHRCPIC